MPLRRLVTGAAVLALAVSGTIAVASAQAAPASVLACQGWSTQSYTPGLTLTTRPTAIRASTVYGPCAGDPAITSGVSTAVARKTRASCLLSKPSHTRGRIRWANGKSSAGVSRYRADNVITRTGGQTVVVSLGRVTSGRFKGHRIRQVIAFTTLKSADCLGPGGVKNVTGSITLTILPL